MEPTPVTLDEETARRLTAANGRPVRLRDPHGRVIGFFVTPAQLARYGIPGHPNQRADVPHIVDGNRGQPQ